MADESVRISRRLPDLHQGGATAALTRYQRRGRRQHPSMRQLASFMLSASRLRGVISRGFHHRQKLLTYLLTD
jgi:hypothetical protein